MPAAIEPDINALRQRYGDGLQGCYSLAMAARQIVERILPPSIVVTTTNRVKSFDSFFEKASKRDEGILRYQSPFEQIKDLVGLRVVVLARRNVGEVCNIVKSSFEIIEEEDKSEALLKEGKLGYESHHFVLKLGESRGKLAEYCDLADLPFELQIRTALQHTWAENEHRIQYKKTKDPELTKRFLRLAAAISSADEEFDRIYEIDQKISGELDQTVDPVGPDDILQIENGRPLKKRLAAISTRFGERPSELVKQGRLSEALLVYNEFIEVQPKQPSHYLGRARVHLLLGDAPAAKADLDAATALAPDSPLVRRMQSIMTQFFAEESVNEIGAP